MSRIRFLPAVVDEAVRVRQIQAFTAAGAARERLYDAAKSVGQITLEVSPPGDTKPRRQPRLVWSPPIQLPELKEPASKISLISRTSKMAAPSFSLPAGPPNFGGACPASRLDGAVGKVRVCHQCYALGGQYTFVGNLVRRMVALVWVHRQLEKGPEQLAQSLIAAIIAYAELQPFNLNYRFFRIHDSGDFLASPRYVQAWVLVAQALPKIRFWAPTRDWIYFGSVKGLKEAMLSRPPNLTIRPSALFVGDEPPVVPGLDAGTDVYGDGMRPGARLATVSYRGAYARCPAYEAALAAGTKSTGPVTGASCAAAKCRACWTKPRQQIGYNFH